MRAAAFTVLAILLLAGSSCTTPFTERGRVSRGTEFALSAGIGGAYMPELFGDDWFGVLAAGATVQVNHGFSDRLAARLGVGSYIYDTHNDIQLSTRLTGGARIGLGPRQSLAVSYTLPWILVRECGRPVGSGSAWFLQGMAPVLVDLALAWDDVAGNTTFLQAGWSGLGGGVVRRWRVASRLDGHVRFQANALPPSASIGVGLEAPAR